MSIFDSLPIGIQDFVSRVKRPTVKPIIALTTAFAVVAGGAYYEHSKSPEKIVRDAFTKFSATDDPPNYNSVTEDSGKFTYDKLSAIAAKKHFERCNWWKVPEEKEEAFPADDLARKYPEDKFVVVILGTEKDSKRDNWEYLYATNCHLQRQDPGPSF